MSSVSEPNLPKAMYGGDPFEGELELEEVLSDSAELSVKYSGKRTWEIYEDLQKAQKGGGDLDGIGRVRSYLFRTDVIVEEEEGRGRGDRHESVQRVELDKAKELG